ncbi:MAG TPA: VCBS repeat-containing protein [Blastocatellia bacterium]|nr:VCBS repeat-containing protein [Blastocatellia bacterium]
MKRQPWLSLMLLAALNCVPSTRAQAPLFTPAPGSPVSVGEGSGLLALADVNRDGKLDLIAQHLLQHLVTVHLGDGAGRFTAAPGSPLKLAWMPGAFKPGDVNGDGVPDLVVTGGDNGVVEIFSGNGSGGFARAPGSPFQAGASAGFNINGLQLVDINEDGNPDIIATSNMQNTFVTMFGDRRGNFTRGQTVTFPASEGRYSFAFGDTDGDGHPDVVITNSGDADRHEAGRAIILRGDGRGAFRSFAEMPVSAEARYLTLGDLNGDGRPDIVLTCGGNTGSNQISILLNQGGGRFALAAPVDLGRVAYAVIVADANRDRQNDLIVATVDSVTVLLNRKNGFAPAPGSPYRAGPGAYHLATGDVNGDGRIDIAASSFEGRTVTVLLGQ